MKRLRITMMILAGALIFSSCKKTNEESVESGQEVLKMDMEENDIVLEEEYADNGCALDLSQLVADCAVITESSTTYPKTITIDYGTGCVDAKGRTKKGKVIIYVTGNIREEGSERNVTFDGFSINDVAITGQRDALNQGPNLSGHMVIKITGNITATKEGKTRTRSFTRYREWLAGISTCAIDDDEFSITGSGTLTTTTGREIPHEITEAIILKPGQCEYPYSGTVDVGSEKRGAIIDYGNGECDNLAEVTLKRNGKTFTFNLETRERVE